MVTDRGITVLAALRKLIVGGELKPGERLTELAIADRLNVSRTPIRLAFRALEQEGLLQRSGARGFTVRKISAEDIANAIAVRGALEGLAAGLAAARGLSSKARQVLLDCLAEGDDLFDRGTITEEDVARFQAMNVAFHQTVIATSGNSAIEDAIARNNALPLAAVTSIAFDRNNMAAEYKRLAFAHTQHHVIFQAIDGRQQWRAEAAMREHANAAMHYATIFDRIRSKEENYRLINLMPDEVA